MQEAEMKTVVRLIVIAALAVLGVLAADISGKWTGDMPGRGGETRPTTFVFKADAEKLTGTMTGPQGDVPLHDGKISGDQITFSTTHDFNGNSIKNLYKGVVNGDQIKMTREREGSGNSREFTIKRSST
jgi:hypothetical protein